MNLFKDSQKEWLQKGGSEDALKFIDAVVGNLHTKAVSEGIIHKELTDDETEDNVEAADETPTEVETEEKSADEGEDVATEEETETEAVESETPVTIDVATVITETIFAAQKQYHDSVVVPLLKEFKDLKATLTKSEQKSAGVFSLDLSGLLPPAAVASKIQKEFGATQTTEVKGTEVKGTPITKKEAAQSPAADGNLLGNFLS